MRIFEIKTIIRLLFKINTLTVILILTCSCVSSYKRLQANSGNNASGISVDIDQKINLLQKDLAALAGDIDIAEAKQIAETSINYSLVLAYEYRLVSPPYLHNILVNLGIKDRGLCHHWADDLIKRLTSLELKSFSLHQGVARKGSSFREHNSVIVTALGQELSDGVVLDPWRNSGELYWCIVKKDKYPWEER